MYEQHSALGYSAVSTFIQCPYKYKLRYIDNIDMLDDYEPTDALKIGTALHKGIETETDTAIKEYFNSYPVISDLHINESIKLETMIKKVKQVIPDGQHEVFIQDGVFKGTIDLLVPVENPVIIHTQERDGQEGTVETLSGDWYDLYDFKYSNNVDKYLESSQLHVYKYYAEKTLGIKIRRLYFVFADKVMIRQKKTETLEQFRLRLRSTLDNASVQIKEVSYDAGKVIDFMQNQVKVLTCNDYIKQKSKLCDFCEYQGYCENDDELNIAPRRWYEG